MRMRVGRRVIDIPNPDKVLFPKAGYTKSDVVEYYRRIAPTMLPYVRGRPVTLHRYPDGIGATGFYQKEAADYFPPWVRTQRVAKEGGSLSMVIVDDAPTLVYLAGQAMITPHVWLSRVDRMDRPDRMIIDLDPAGSEFETVRQAATWARERLEELGLVSFVMTTGSSGLHVVVPLNRTTRFDSVRELARRVADTLVDEHSDVLTTEQRKVKRRGKVYLDTLRNAYAQTAVAPYALRARADGPVATPLAWDELDQPDMSPTRYTMRTVLERLDETGDPWKGMSRRARSIIGAQRKIGIWERKGD
jgi:bifunctional non-homologous end joining protein LigD